MRSQPRGDVGRGGRLPCDPFAWETGLRPATIARVRVDDYDGARKRLRIRDSADKARYGRELPLSERTSWQFAADSIDVIRRGEGPDPDVGTGFLSAYGATNPENDFNVYAEKIFTEPHTVASAARAHALVARKVSFVLDADLSVDGRMGEVFRRLGVL